MSVVQSFVQKEDLWYCKKSFLSSDSFLQMRLSLQKDSIYGLKCTKMLGWENTQYTGKENHKHVKLVSAHKSLRTNLPYLSTHKKYKYLKIHNTINSLDGGISSPMKLLIKTHRGLNKSLKLKMVDDYLVRDKEK